jgi:hypothetical protein
LVKRLLGYKLPKSEDPYSKLTLALSDAIIELRACLEKLEAIPQRVTLTKVVA